MGVTPDTRKMPRPADGAPIGSIVVRAMRERLSPDVVRVHTSARVRSLEPAASSSSWTVRVEDGPDDAAPRVFEARAVIVATGGFGAATGLALPTTNGPTATGDGLDLARDVGAEAIDLECVQVHPTGFVDPQAPDAPTKILAPEALRGAGALLIDPSTGRRFVDELATRDVVTAAMPPGEEAVLWLPLQEEDSSSSSPGTEAHKTSNRGPLGFYEARGLLTRVESVEQAARLVPRLQLNTAALAETLRAYDEAAQTTGPDAFGKTVFPGPRATTLQEGAPPTTTPKEVAPALVGRVVPCVHYTMGGLRIDGEARVLRRGTKDEPIPGLFAAGEATGGLHGANRLAGNSLLECVVFGRQAGLSAAVHALAASAAATQHAMAAHRHASWWHAALAGVGHVVRRGLLV
mmetsp:Transcript_18622/g.74359  ORF Transcript_18622/g.74359 Transcript_18622/m.74359 type:complete len:406 (+) Transcript_18622:472-1689(+)